MDEDQPSGADQPEAGDAQRRAPSETYPPQLPDLFHGSQLVVLGRYAGKGPAALKLTGFVGKEKKEFVYELTFPDKTGAEKEFVEQLWARRRSAICSNRFGPTGRRRSWSPR